jgi:hypothetical protein
VGSYFQWREIPATELDPGTFQQEAFRTFREAVALRSASRSRPVAFLTGGLDSRAVVGALVSLGKVPNTLNFAYPGLMDGTIAADLARRLETRHRTWPVPEWRKVGALTVSVPAQIEYDPEEAPDDPRAVFSGDGGSVGLGFVYLDERILELVRGKRLDDLAAYYLRRKRIPRRIFRPDAYRRLEHLAEEGWREELARAKSREPGKDFHVFLMENDQRRHLHYMFEDLDLNRVEFLLPFYDARWLALIGSAPVDWFLLHRFYYDWIRLFPEPVHATPWQAYPGHLPCPVPQPAALRSQWKLPKAMAFEASQAAYQAARRQLLGQGFPAPIFRRGPLMAGMVAHGLRARNLSHFWKTLDTYRRYYDRSNRTLVWP